ncbi:MAG TPA: adenylyltransferase/cytidyltransferase family protein [Candidatus Saccharimonadales bacterium]|nr:adenylyltransferase/cytidyltransferase family protein [Candidatus Saccharimonadales bacterium]
MKEAVLYTGTFDPYHLGHLWQLERTYRAHPFDKAVVAIIKTNPKKPLASSWQNRIKLANLMLTSHRLPFVVEVHTIDYIQPENLKQFAARYLNGYHIVRTVASDVIVEFAKDKKFGLNDALLLFHYTVVVRPTVNQRELEAAIAELPLHIAKKFSYEIVHVQVEEDISATNIRQNPKVAFEKGYIIESQLDFIKQKQLYY